MTLKTDYKDEQLNTDVNTVRKFKLIENDDETVSFEDVTEYTQKGDTFGAADINKTNSAVQECFQSVSDGKALIASAITDKGVSTAMDATFEAMAENIANIASLSSENILNSGTASVKEGGTATATLYLPPNSTYMVISFANGGTRTGYEGSSYAAINWDLSSITVEDSNGDVTNLRNSLRLHTEVDCLCTYRVDVVNTGETVSTFTASATGSGTYKPSVQVNIIAIGM